MKHKKITGEYSKYYTISHETVQKDGGMMFSCICAFPGCDWAYRSNHVVYDEIEEHNHMIVFGGSHMKDAHEEELKQLREWKD